MGNQQIRASNKLDLGYWLVYVDWFNQLVLSQVPEIDYAVFSTASEESGV